MSAQPIPDEWLPAITDLGTVTPETRSQGEGVRLPIDLDDHGWPVVLEVPVPVGHPDVDAVCISPAVPSAHWHSAPPSDDPTHRPNVSTPCMVRLCSRSVSPSTDSPAISPACHPPPRSPPPRQTGPCRTPPWRRGRPDTMSRIAGPGCGLPRWCLACDCGPLRPQLPGHSRNARTIVEASLPADPRPCAAAPLPLRPLTSANSAAAAHRPFWRPRVGPDVPCATPTSAQRTVPSGIVVPLRTALRSQSSP